MNTDALHDAATLETALSGEALLLFKHSPICPVSARAFGEYRRFLERHGPLPTAWIDVIDGRPLSRSVEQRTGVRHESPQALIVAAGAVRWHASHGAITVESLERAWDEHAR